MEFDEKKKASHFPCGTADSNAPENLGDGMRRLSAGMLPYTLGKTKAARREGTPWDGTN
jgi:hypothetical protein